MSWLRFGAASPEIPRAFFCIYREGVRPKGMSIKRRRVGIIWVLAAALFLSIGLGRGAEQVDSAAVLRKTGIFALGGIGVAGTISEGERALREIIKESDAAARLDTLVSDASPAGQLYALLGLRRRDRAAYERALEKLRTTDAKVQTARGCMLQQESFRDLVKEIERGNYDTFLAREWPERAR